MSMPISETMTCALRLLMPGIDMINCGKHILYRLAGDAEVVALVKALGRVGERNIAEISRVVTDYFHARDALEPVSRDDLVARLRDDLVTVLDVRPEDEFALGHLRGRSTSRSPN